jgi:putative DNA primase/helicase
LVWQTQQDTPTRVEYPGGGCEKLESEKAGILNWMIEGWLAVKESGLHVPSVIKTATDQFFNDRNELSAFFDECVDRVPDARVAVAELYATYRAWCAIEAISPRTQREFGQLLRTVHKLDQERSSSARHWRGIKLKEGPQNYLHCSTANGQSEPTSLNFFH